MGGGGWGGGWVGFVLLEFYGVWRVVVLELCLLLKTNVVVPYWKMFLPFIF